MKKILFNDKIGLTKAVLEGKKTQTRRVITYPKKFHGIDVCGFYVYRRATDGVITEVCMYDENESSIDEGQILPKYGIGEVVAVAQCYNDFYDDTYNPTLFPEGKGWENKMFVKAELMPHRIRITDIRVEKLQDISDEDCLKEGIFQDSWDDTFPPSVFYDFEGNKENGFKTPREAFAALINKVSGKGTWEKNPFVFVYDFELVKEEGE